MSKPTTVVLVLLALLTLGTAIVAALRAPGAFRGFPGGPAAPPPGLESSGLPVLADQMPEFTGIAQWWNTPNGAPLTPAELKGKVVLVDFWTYSCINCIRTYPFLKTMWDRYAADGLVIVGVHTPEFAFEADPANVGRAITENGLRYPVALDPDYGTWNAYGNQYWPAEYLFDGQGRLRHVHFGEGEYDRTEAAIRALLAEDGLKLGATGPAVAMPDLSGIRTLETYFGLKRGSAFMGTPGAVGQDGDYQAAAKLSSDRWTIGGRWQFQPEYVQADAAADVFRFSVQADALHLVLESADGQDKRIEISVDGRPARALTVNEAKLYTVAEFPKGGRHVVEVRVLDAGIRFYSATFS